MGKQQTPDETKLSNCKICVLTCTYTFVAEKTKTNIGFFDHWDIICAISDRSNNNRVIV
jgi:hypothetical protein